MKRADGFYWVRFEDRLMVAEWDRGAWLLTGDDEPQPESEIEWVGEMIPPPVNDG